MSLTDRFLDRLNRAFTWAAIGTGRFVLTKYQNERLPEPVILHLDERLLERYVASLVHSGLDDNEDEALGTVLNDLEASVTVDRPEVLIETGLKRGLRHPHWFDKVIKPGGTRPPIRAWVADPPS